MFDFINANLSELNSIGLFLTNCVMLYIVLNQGKLTKLVGKLVDVCQLKSSSEKDSNGTSCGSDDMSLKIP